MISVLLGVCAALSWSIHDILARSLAARIDPFRIAALGMVAGGVLLSGHAVTSETLSTARPATLLLAASLGLAYGFGVAGLFKAFSLGPVTVVAPLTAAYPILVVLWGIFHGLAPTPLQWAAAAAALAGAFIVARFGHADGGINTVKRSDLPALAGFCLLSAVGYAAAVVLGQSAAVEIGEVEATWLSRPVALISIAPFLWGERRPAPLALRHWSGVFAMGGLDVLGVIAVNAAGHYPNAEFAAIGISSYGATAVILALLFLKEKVALAQWGGILLITIGVTVLSLA